jgi:hypothetical protein
VPDNIGEIDCTVLFSTKTSDAGSGEDLFSQAVGNVKEGVVEYSPEPQLGSEQNPKIDDEVGSQRMATIDQASQLEGGTKDDAATSSPIEDIEFYDLFLTKIQAMCSDSPKTTDELVDALELNKTQLNAWLKRAVADKKLKKLSKPVRYQWGSTQQGALLL